MTTRPTRPAIALAALLSACGSAPAQDAPAPDPAPDVLRGPKVSEPARAPTLVKRDMSGRLERLEARPEEEAVALLTLTPEQRSAVDALLVERRAKVSALLEREYELFLRLQNARQAGAEPQELRTLTREFRAAAADLLTPPLQDRLAEALPESQRAEFRRLVTEYQGALAAEGEGERRGQRAPRAAAAPARAAERMETSLLLREVARSLRAVVEERRENMDAFLKAVEATPEQEKQIRDLTRAAAEAGRDRGGLGGTRDDQAAAHWKRVMDVLTPEQRARAMKFRRGGA